MTVEEIIQTALDRQRLKLVRDLMEVHRKLMERAEQSDALPALDLSRYAHPTELFLLLDEALTDLKQATAWGDRLLIIATSTMTLTLMDELCRTFELGYKLGTITAPEMHLVEATSPNPQPPKTLDEAPACGDPTCLACQVRRDYWSAQRPH